MNKDKTVKTKDRKSFLRKVFRLLFIFFITFSISIVILSNFKFFRSFLLNKALNIVNNELIAKIEAEDLYFSGFNGMIIKNARLLTAGDTLAYVKSIELKINYEDIFNNKIHVYNLILDSPKVKLFNNKKDSIWNYDLIAPPSTDTTETEPTDLIILADKLILKNTEFIMWDSTSTLDTTGIVDFSHLHLKNLNMELKADVRPGLNSFKAAIKSLSFYENHSKMLIKKFSSDLQLDSSIISASNTEILIDKSKLKLDASLKNFNVFSKIEPKIEEADINVRLYAGNFESYLIDFFYKMPLKIGRTHLINADISGNFLDMNLNRINIISDEQEVYLSGNLYNIGKENFRYIVRFDESKISENSLKTTLPESNFDGLPDFKFVTFNELFVNGTDKDVSSIINFKSKFGKIDGKVNLTFGINEPFYSGNLDFSSLKLEKIAKNMELLSELNGKINFEGKNFEFDKLNLRTDLELNNSKFRDIEINNLYSNLSLNQDKTLNIDSLKIIFRRNTITGNENTSFKIFEEENGLISVKGMMDITNLNNPGYDLEIKTQSVDLNSLLDNKNFPSHLSAELNLSGRGFDIDSLNGSYNINIEELLFNDRAIMPFQIKTDLRKSNDKRDIDIESDYLNAKIEGKFNLSEFIKILADEGVFLSEFINEKLKSIQPNIGNIDSISTFNKVTFDKFPNIEVKLLADVKDISIFNAFIDSLDIYSNVYFDMGLFSDSTFSSIFIDSLNVKNFQLQSNDLNINADNIILSSTILMSVNDSLPEFETFNLKVNQGEKFEYNDFIIENPVVNLKFDGEDFDLDASLKIQELFQIQSKGIVSVKDEGIDFNISQATFTLSDSTTWKLSSPLIAKSAYERFTVQSMQLNRDKYETINLKGSVYKNIAEDIELEFKNLKVENILKTFTPDIYKELNTLVLNIDSSIIKINGDLKEPNIKLKFDSDTMHFSNINVGKLKGSIEYQNSVFTGLIDVRNRNLINNELLNLKINYLPIYIGLDTNREMFPKDKEFDIRVSASKLPAALAEPFAPGVEELKGLADASIIIDGILPEKVNYRGNLNLINGGLKVISTNLHYNAELKASFENDKVFINQLEIKNKPEDVKFGRIGKADVTGYVNLIKFKPGYLDINVKAERLLVMSDATVSTMPDLYGDFIISTDENPIHFFGTLEEPNLEGDVNVMYADIKTPLLQKKQAIRTNFSYQFVDNKYKLNLKTTRDTLNNNDTQQEISPEDIEKKSNKNIAELINYNMRVKIIGQFNVTMDMNLIGEMHAIIGTPDKTVPLRYEKFRDQEQAKLFGEVTVKDQSIIKSLKQFNTWGNISFPTGSIENPTLDLVATHSGTSYNGNNKTPFIVKMYITGTKVDPKVRFTYFVDGIEGSGSQEQINEDALYLMVMGRTKNSLNQSPGSASIINEGLTSGFSNFATKALSELLASTGVIQSAAFDFRGGSLDLNQATVKLSGQIYGGISWTFGGSLSDISGNNEITVDIPASEFSNNPFWSNFVLQLTKASTTNTTNFTQDAKNWEIKVKLGSSW